MNKNIEFNHFLHSRSAFIMLSEDAIFLDMNHSAEKLLETKSKHMAGKALINFLNEPERIEKILSLWRRSQINLPALLQLKFDNKLIEIKAYGYLASAGTAEHPGIIILECEKKEKSNKNFSALNNKIEQLNKEMILRKRAENNLHNLISATSTSTGEEFFNNFSSQLTKALRISQVIICEHINNKTVILAISNDSKKNDVDFCNFGISYVKEKMNFQDYKPEDLNNNLVIDNLKIFTECKNNILCFPLADKNNNLLGNICIADDKPIENVENIIKFIKPFSERASLEISRKRTEEELNYAKQDLEKRVKERTKELDVALKKSETATRSKSEFLANMSHEIRTPMNGVLGMLNLMQDTSLNQEQKNLINTAYTSAETLLHILNDILDLSKIEAGKMKLENIDFDLRQTVEDIATLFSTDAYTKELEIICDIAEDIPTLVNGDPTRIQQVLSNLVGNAIKFTNEGEVVISVFLKTTRENKLNIFFEIRDTGIGVSKEAISKIFESFSQADGTTTRKFGGSGLGLTICKQLVEILGGELKVQSTLGEGSIFKFNILLEKSKHSLNTNPEDIHLDLARLRALLVDDNETHLKTLSNHFKNWNIDHNVVSSAQEAIFLLNKSISSKKPYNLLVTDMVMPEMNGLQMIEILRSKTEFEDLKILILDSVTSDIRVKAENLNVAAVLNKPVKQSLLYDTIISETQHISTIKNETVQKNISREFHTPNNNSVLVVEDNVINQKVIKGLLNKLNIEIDIANNGQEALDKLKDRTFDLVFMDCQMPVMDGFEATKKIRSQNFPNRDVPIIAVTANAMSGDKEKCLASGMDDYISKPLSIQKLQECLITWLGDNQQNSKITSLAK